MVEEAGEPPTSFLVGNPNTQKIQDHCEYCGISVDGKLTAIHQIGPNKFCTGTEYLSTEKLETEQFRKQLEDFKKEVAQEKSISPDLVVKGDRISLTIGQEMFVSGKYGGSFTVGPITVEIQVQEGETLVDAQVRLRQVASITWETEFQLKLSQYPQRAEQVKENLG